MKKLLFVLLSTGALACSSLDNFIKESDKTTARFQELLQQLQKEPQKVVSINKEMQSLYNKRIYEIIDLKISHLDEYGGTEILSYIEEESSVFYKAIRQADKMEAIINEYNRNNNTINIKVD